MNRTPKPSDIPKLNEDIAKLQADVKQTDIYLDEERTKNKQLQAENQALRKTTCPNILKALDLQKKLEDSLAQHGQEIEVIRGMLKDKVGCGLETFRNKEFKGFSAGSVQKDKPKNPIIRKEKVEKHE